MIKANFNVTVIWYFNMKMLYVDIALAFMVTYHYFCLFGIYGPRTLILKSIK